MTNSRKKIALIFAMEAEAAPLIRHLGLSLIEGWGDSRLPFKHYFGKYEDYFDILVSVNGKDPTFGVDSIGTEPSALNAYITLNQFRPDLCMNCGTAGGFHEQQAQIGDVYLSTEAFRYHDRRIEIPGFDEYGVGHYPVLKMEKMAAALELKLGVVSTGSSLDCTEIDKKSIRRNNGAVKEMEAAAVAYVASQLKIKFFALKAITDWVDLDHATGPVFLKNLDLASRRLFEKTLEVFAYLAVNPSDWC